MRIIAVVVAHSRPDLLPDVIAALQKQTVPPDRILIVDNASDVDIRDAYRNVDGIGVIRSEVNLGGTGGFVLGLKQASALGADWIWLLDDDAIPRTDALVALLNRLPELPANTGALCGTVIEYGNVALMHRRYFGWKLGIETCVTQESYRKVAMPIDTGSFVGFLVSAVALVRVGLPETDFFLAYDDTEFSLRMRARGMELWLVPASIVDHMRCASARLRATEFGPKHYFNIRNRIVVKRRYAQYSRISAWSAILFGFGIWLCSPGRFRKRSIWLMMKAISDGYHGRLGPMPGGENGVPQAEIIEARGVDVAKGTR